LPISLTDGQDAAEALLFQFLLIQDLDLKTCLGGLVFEVLGIRSRVELIGWSIGQRTRKRDSFGADDRSVKDIFVLVGDNGYLHRGFIGVSLGGTDTAGGITTQDEPFYRGSQAEITQGRGNMLLSHQCARNVAGGAAHRFIVK